LKIEHAKESPERDLSDRQVNMSNALINAAHSLTLSEKRVMSCAVAKLDSVRAPRHGESPTIKLSASEYAETFKVTKDTAYDELQSAADNLFQRYIRIIENTRKGPKEYKFRWVGGVKYHKGEGWVELGFWHEVVPHLMVLRKNFTSYKLAQASGLRSIYSWRLLELLAQFKTTGLVRKDIDAFIHAMDAPESCQKNFKDLRRRIIEPAVAELITKDGWMIEWTTIRTGRKVTGLEFRFERDPQIQLPLEPPEPDPA
jgi:plasmid replication initiation protein